MGRVSGKVAIITGGARGMGAAHVRKLHAERAKVAFTDILVEEGEALAKELGESVKFMKHDVSKASDWEEVITGTEATFGPVDVLVNNAGILLVRRMEELTEEEYRRVIDVNQVSVFLGMKAVLPSMRKRSGGSIINISSVSGIGASIGHSAYNSSKFAVRGITKTAALEFAEYGIRVNSIHPGAVDTSIITEPEKLGELAQTIPLRRIGRPEEVSNLVLFLASDESSFVTGSEFVIDGGKLARI